MPDPVFLITGASTGIGAASAPGAAPLAADDVAEAVMYAVTRPAHVDVNEILVRPVEQQR